MAKGLLAQKVGMTQLFSESGTVVPVTVLAARCSVVQRKTAARDGYDAVQIGAGDVPPRKMNKPLSGHFKRVGVKPMRHLAEIRDAGEVAVGAQLSVDIFTAGDRVSVTSDVTKGKGTAGTVKRHHFARGPGSHGSMNIRQPGSIGSVDAARVFRGLPMAGHLGAQRATVRGLTVFRVDAERNLLLIAGSVPGSRNGMVLVKHANKRATFDA